MTIPGAVRSWLAVGALAAVSAVAAAACSAAPIATPRVTPGTSVRPRDVNIVARDYTFSPPVVDFVPGETVVLHVINGGLVIHEAIIGNQAVQDAWEMAEAQAPPAPPGNTPAVSVPPGMEGLRITVRSGERVDVTWTVPAQPSAVALLIVGCHIPGHYAKGMYVPVRVAVVGAPGG